MFVVGLNGSMALTNPKGKAMNTYWTQDDMLTNLSAEVKAVKDFYNVPTLNHVPDCEVTIVKYAQLGDLVHVGKGRIGICIDILTCGGTQAVAMVLDNGRVITRERSL
jgi:hypothetical protein